MSVCNYSTLGGACLADWIYRYDRVSPVVAVCVSTSKKRDGDGDGWGGGGVSVRGWGVGVVGICVQA